MQYQASKRAAPVSALHGYLLRYGHLIHSITPIIVQSASLSNRIPVIYPIIQKQLPINATAMLAK